MRTPSLTAPSRSIVLAVALVGLVAGLLAGASAAPGGSPAAGAAEPLDLSGAVLADFTVQPGVEQVTVVGATPRSPLTIVDADDVPLLTLYTDDLGQVVFSYIPDEYLVFDPNDGGVLPTTEGGTLDPGDYRIVDETTDPIEASDTFTVLAIDDHPDPALYEGQTLVGTLTNITGGYEDGYTAEDGYQYIEVRDGVELSVMVRFPDPDFYGDGPYPTVVEYSGYGPSNPGQTEPGSLIATSLGFASVGVNLRGTGCSGGTFDVFNAAQMADGYDVIETVARQPWVKHNQVGMVGLSYGGIMQLYVGATNPPSLAAITPLSVIEDPWYQQWPGGIYNSGFTQQWLAQRDAQSAPGGVNWVNSRITGGDTVCADNMDIRSQNIDFEEFARSLERRPRDADARRLSNLVEQIEAPVYLTGAWQDEQTGARFATMLDDFANVPAGQTKFTMFNGRHPDGYTPLVLTRWFEFLSFYVDQEVPYIGPLVRTGTPDVFEDNFGVPGMNFEPNRFYKFGTDEPIHPDFATALAAYEAEPQVRVLFESGAGPTYVDDHPGAPEARWALTFPSWPPPTVTPEVLYLGPGGTLVDAAPATRSIDRYQFDADVGETSYASSGAYDFQFPQIDADWQSTPDGKGLSYLTEPLPTEMIIAGNGHVDLWFRSTGTDAGIEVVLSEVYEDPDAGDGVAPEEVIVQTGLLRAAYPELDPDRSDDLLKEHLFYSDNYHPLEKGEFVHLQVPIFPVAHPFRAGSRLRLEINTPGGDTPLWEFENPDYGATTHDVSLGGDTASALVLPLYASSNPFQQIPGPYKSQAARPPCNSLRGQVCRDYVPLANETVYVAPECDDSRFSDVGAGDEFCPDITWLSDEEVADGYEDGTYRPGAAITRQAMAAFLYRTAGEPIGEDPACTDSPFPDVPVSSPFCGEIAWMVEEGLSTGFPDGTYRPGATITRQAMAAFLYRLAGSPDGDDPACTEAPFPDVPADAPLCGEIAWLVGTGITTGFEDGTFRPGAPVSRQAMAAFLHRYHVYDL